MRAYARRCSMRLRSTVLTLMSFAVLIYMACSDDDSGGPTVRDLTVTQTFPADKAHDVNLNPLIRVWFNQALDEASVTWDCMHVEGAETQRIECDEASRSISLYLKNVLEPDSTYRVVIDQAISSADGEPMASDAEFEFTTTGTVDCQHLVDYFEPNDDIPSAAEIELDTYYTCLSSCGGDERLDFFKFTVDTPVQIRAYARHSFSWGDTVDFIVNYLRLDGEYYYQIHSSLATNWGINNDFTFYPGTYLVEVGKPYDDAELLVYYLVLTTRPACEDDIYEDNDFLDEAAPVPPGLYENLTGCVNDRDYFQLELNTGQTLTGTLTQVTDLRAGRYIKIFDPDGLEVASEGFYGHQEPISVSWTAAESGSHFVCVRWHYYGIKYDLDIDVSD
jgi:hypothetical protein